MIWLFGEIWAWVLAGFAVGLLTGLWLRRGRSRDDVRLQPEAKWHVSIGESLHVVDGHGKAASIAMDAIGSVVIETNASGPWGMDFWWQFYDREGVLACQFPEGATGEAEVLAQLEALTGYDRQEASRAIRSTSDGEFTVWRRATARSATSEKLASED